MVVCRYDGVSSMAAELSADSCTIAKRAGVGDKVGVPFSAC